jgi:transposase
MSGAVFAFTNKKRDRLKILYWDGTGVCLFCKRLEKGRYSWPVEAGASKVVLNAQTLSMIVGGIDLKKTEKKAWFSKNNT